MVAILIGAALPGVPAALLITMTISLALVAIVCFAFPSSSNPTQQLHQDDAHSELAPGEELPVVIRIALAFDESYAAPAAVVIQSLLDHHQAESVSLEIAVLDVGITGVSWTKLASMVHGRNASLHHIPAMAQLLSSQLAKYPAVVREKWPVFSRLWLDRLLPVEWSHVLYLDCDVLVRGSLIPLWRQLLSSSVPLLAVRDFGLPSGREALAKFGWTKGDEYFNAGVLAMNLAEIRSTGLGRVVRSFSRQFAGDTSLQHHDQCILNVVFWRRWQPVAMEYNVQGMGTYADERIYAERHRCALYTPVEWRRIQRFARIVHFTGPESPSLAEFLCRYVRPPSKPWSWFCHHPLASQYMALLATTPFAGWKAPDRERIVDDFSLAIRRTINEAQQHLGLSAAEVEIALQKAISRNYTSLRP